ncbi:MAG: M20/M25/M40 family metallo-hydrolase [Anaerolineae bacterium]
MACCSGAAIYDDKGDLSTRLHAVEAWLATRGQLPHKIKWVVEGEEEIGSVNLPAWAEKYHDMLAADGVLWEGGGYDSLGRPQMAAGCKGICYVELHADGPAVDLHSSFAPIVPNPAWRLVHALATMKDPDDHIIIDGYMDHVAPISAELRAALEALPSDDLPERQANWQLKEWLGGVSEREAFIRLYTEPTMTISGFHSGYGGPGSKTVLPAHAYAKIDFRLVPNLTYGTALKLVREHLDRRGYQDIEVRLIGGEEPADSPIDSRIKRAAVKASEQVWNKTPLVFPRFAGSGPMYPLSTMINVPTISCGAVSHPDSKIHSPNENIYEKDYVDAMRLFAALMDNFAAEA